MQAIISVFEFPPKESFRILDGKIGLYKFNQNYILHQFLFRMLKYLMNLLKMYLVILESLYGM